MALFRKRGKGGNAERRRLEPDMAEPRPEARPTRPRTVGETLRAARERHNTSLQQVAGALRIRQVFLQAIEDSRYQDLPGLPYAVGFVRAYAEYLGLDGAEMVRRFKNEAAGLEAKQALHFPVPLAERGIPGGTVLIVAVILAVCAYVTWYYVSAVDRARPERVAAVPSRLLPVPPRDAAPASPPAGEASPAVSPAAPAAEPATPSATGSASAAPAVAALPSPTTSPAGEPPSAPPPLPPTTANEAAARLPAIPEPPPASPDAPRVYGATSGPVRVVIKATADSWVQVRDSDQTLLLTRVLRAGEVYRVPNRPGLSMRTGNAGGLEVSVDGQPAPALGPAGRTKNVQLNPERLLAGTAAAE